MDKALQREQTKERVKRYRERGKGVTSAESVTRTEELKSVTEHFVGAGSVTEHLVRALVNPTKRAKL